MTRRYNLRNPAGQPMPEDWIHLPDSVVASADYDALTARLAEARGCFDAALFEGWLDALANGDIERIRDLWTRRISFAMEAVTADSAPVAFWDCDCGQVNDDPTCIRCGATPTVPVAPEAK